MKKIYATILTAILTVTLCACGSGGNSGDTGGSGSIAPTGFSRGDAEFESYVAEVPDADIPMPDGSTRRKDDIDRLNENGVITFDVAYVYYPEARFENSIDDPDLFSKDYNKEDSEPLIEPNIRENIEWKGVKTGDVLENGLVVESAYTTPVYDYPFENDTVEYQGSETVLTFSGELELEGILVIYPGNENYGYADSSVTFIPDCTKYVLPIPYNGSEELEFKTSYNVVNETALIYSGAEFNFGNIEDSGYDFDRDTPAFSKVRLKITNVRSLWGGYDGDILECTILDK